MAESQIPIPRRHPAEEELVAYAAGQLDASRRILLEGHLTYCPACGETWSSFTSAGGQLLREAPDASPPSPLLDSLLARVQAERFAPDPYAGLPLPSQLLAVLPRSNQPLTWNSPGDRTDNAGRVSRLVDDRQADAQLFLLEIPAGEHIPRHQHLGSEHVLCLSGACSDEFTHLEAGDYYHYDPGTEHFPVMEPGEPCWIAVRLERGLRYTG